MNLCLTEAVTSRLTQSHLRFVSWTVLAISVVVLAVSFATVDKGRTVLGTELGFDYAAFYIAGRIQNEYSTSSLYDLPLQNKLYHDLLSTTGSLPYANAPFLAPLFRPLARLPYAVSYFVWLLISLGLFLAGLILLLRITSAFTSAGKKTLILLVLSFEPFIMECWIGGQISTIGFFLMALGLYFLRCRHLVWAGVALACCLYKPTLLVLLVPALALSRNWRVLAGFAVGALGLATISLVAIGKEACLDYLRILISYTQATTGQPEIFRTWKFVDIVSFFRLLQGGHSLLGWIAIILFGVVASVFVIRAWQKKSRTSTECQCLLWSATIAITLVTNLYVGIYDVILVVPAVILSADALLRQGTLSVRYQLLYLLLYVVPWCSSWLAFMSHVQMITLVLAGFAIVQFRLIERFRRMATL